MKIGDVEDVFTEAWKYGLLDREPIGGDAKRGYQWRHKTVSLNGDTPAQPKRRGRSPKQRTADEVRA
jgi:hypothetical protein